MCCLSQTTLILAWFSLKGLLVCKHSGLLTFDRTKLLTKSEEEGRREVNGPEAICLLSLCSGPDLLSSRLICPLLGKTFLDLAMKLVDARKFLSPYCKTRMIFF